jgi:hypothetical protein
LVSLGPCVFDDDRNVVPAAALRAFHPDRTAAARIDHGKLPSTICRDVDRHAARTAVDLRYLTHMHREEIRDVDRCPDLGTREGLRVQRNGEADKADDEEEYFFRGHTKKVCKLSFRNNYEGFQGDEIVKTTWRLYSPGVSSAQL